MSNLFAIKIAKANGQKQENRFVRDGEGIWVTSKIEDIKRDLRYFNKFDEYVYKPVILRFEEFDVEEFDSDQADDCMGE